MRVLGKFTGLVSLARHDRYQRHLAAGEATCLTQFDQSRSDVIIATLLDRRDRLRSRILALALIDQLCSPKQAHELSGILVARGNLRRRNMAVLTFRFRL